VERENPPLENPPMRLRQIGLCTPILPKLPCSPAVIPEMQLSLTLEAQTEFNLLSTALIERIHKLILAGQTDVAVAAASQLSVLRPRSPKAHSVLYQARMASGDREGAQTAHRTVVDLVATAMEASPRPLSLQERMSVFGQFIFLGGPKEQFEKIGKLQLQVLLNNGLRPDHKVLDIGCGCLRAGVHIMEVLNPGNYCGLEPNTTMLEFGKTHVVGAAGLVAAKPNFDNNFEFDFTPFQATFDFFVARSIWTHASKPQIESMLDGFLATAAPDAVFLASFYPALADEDDYKESGWTGRSESSCIGGCIRHSPAWIARACVERGLQMRQDEDAPIENGQVWLRITRATT